MEYTTFSVRMETEIKRQFDDFCNAVGMNATTAFNMFARAVLREHRLPFEITNDPFYNENNMDHIRRVIADAKAGRNMHEHELIEKD